MKAAATLLLFDIDGTLVDTGGAGLVSLEAGFYQAFPDHRSTDFPLLDLGGATDSGVVGFLFEYFGVVDTPEHRSRFYECYTGSLSFHLRKFSAEEKGRVLPGVEALLAALVPDPSFELGVLTGNVEAGAWIKLRHFALDRHFSHGAFGCDHHDRNKLGPIARERARQACGVDFPPERIIVLGDTPKDVACARALGARVIAVATGAATRQSLELASPDILMDDFSDTPAVLTVLEALRGGIDPR